MDGQGEGQFENIDLFTQIDLLSSYSNCSFKMLLFGEKCFLLFIGYGKIFFEGIP